MFVKGDPNSPNSFCYFMSIILWRDLKFHAFDTRSSRLIQVNSCFELHQVIEAKTRPRACRLTRPSLSFLGVFGHDPTREPACADIAPRLNRVRGRRSSLEIAKDYAIVAHEVIDATQVKDTQGAGRLSS